MGDNWGVEVPLWFAPPGAKPIEFSFHRSTDFEHVARECRAVRTGVGISGEHRRSPNTRSRVLMRRRGFPISWPTGSR